jgi:hypothetical protein
MSWIPLNNKRPTTAQIKEFLNYFSEGGGFSPRKKLEMRSAIITAYLIADIQRQSRLKKR